jgi:hypothetical protein
MSAEKAPSPKTVVLLMRAKRLVEMDIPSTDEDIFFLD